MTQPFNALAVVDQFLYYTLSHDATLKTLMPAGQFYPRYAPPTVTGIHVIYQFIGPDGGNMAVPAGRGVGQIELYYVLTAWNTGQSLQPLAPVTMRIQVLLVGPDLRGRIHQFTDSFGTGWNIEVCYKGPGIVAPEVNPAWQPSAEKFSIYLRQKGA